MEALTRAVASGKVRYHRLLRMAGRPDPRRDRHGGRRPLRLQPAAIFPALARAREGGDPALRRQRHLPDRLVAARPGRAHRQICARRAAARRQPRDQRGNGRLDGRLAAAGAARGGPEAEAARRRSRPQPRPVRPGLGAARAQCRLGDRRRLAPVAGRRECRRLRRRGRSGAVRRGRADRRPARKR